MRSSTSWQLPERLKNIRELVKSNELDGTEDIKLKGLNRIMNYDDWDMWDMWGSQSLAKRTKHRNTTETTQLVIIQPTPFCNINCSYCYLPNRNSTEKISEKTLEQIFDKVFSSPFTSEALNFVWHTGEPLVMPISFYEKAFKLMDKANSKSIKTVNSFQTNGMLINEDWCRLFQREDIDIGVSLDGPEFLHNSRRVDRKGKGTFEEVMNGICMLQKHNIPFSTISVLTKEALNCPDEIWNFFVSSNITRLCFNVEEIEGVNTTSSLESNEIHNKFKAFFKRIIELNQINPEISVRELDFFFGNIIYGTDAIPVLSTENKPFVILAFDYNGNISTFSPELLTMHHKRFEAFTFGNAYSNTIEEIRLNSIFQEINVEIIEGIKKCERECQFFSLCGGGPPVNKLYETGRFDVTDTMYCNLKVKALVETTFEFLEEKYSCEPTVVR